jgi:hypothetical protein
MSYIGNQPQYTSFLSDTFSGNGVTTQYTMAVAPANTAAVLVAISGVLQDPSTYGVVGRILTFSQAPPIGVDNISVRYLALPASNVTTTAYRSVTEFTATAGQTTFTPASYTPGFINVFRSGVRLGAANFTATNGVTIVLTNAAAAGDLITIESFFVSSVLNAIPNVAGAITPTLLDSTSQSGSGALQIPTGTTAQRPTSPSVGMLRYNTTLDSVDVYRSTGWKSVDAGNIEATGGEINTYVIGNITYRIHTFTASGNFVVTAGTGAIEYLVVGGGGGGGRWGAGGGGAGGYRTDVINITIGSYPVTVGAGGAGATTNAGSSISGSNSVFGSITSLGGGGGGSRDGDGTGKNGGSGGGGGSSGSGGGSGTAGQGNAGGTGGPNAPAYAGGGGGGAGGSGTASSTTVSGTGGAGLSNTIRTGSPIFYAGGGGGSSLDPTSGGLGGVGGGGNGIISGTATPGNPGGINTGGGGGATQGITGGAGGSGIVIIRYAI